MGGKRGVDTWKRVRQVVVGLQIPRYSGDSLFEEFGSFDSPGEFWKSLQLSNGIF